MKSPRFFVIALVAMLSACTGIRPDPILRSGPGVDFDSTVVTSFRESQDKVLKELYQSAGLEKDKPASSPDDWSQVINAGMDFADQRCEAYMHALFRLNRDRSTAVSQIGLVGTATAGILAATAAAAKEVAITAILFGLGSASVENYSSNLLYDLEPSSVRTLVRGLQAGYRAGLSKTGNPAKLDYDTRPGAIAVIRGYATLCVPANIEAEVNLAVKKAQPSVKVGDGATGQPPAVSHNLTVATELQITDMQRITRAVAKLIKDETKLAEINRVLKAVVPPPHTDFTEFNAAAGALDNAVRDIENPSDTQKWLKALGI